MSEDNAHQGLLEILKRWKLRTSEERLLQEDLETVLTKSGVSFEREKNLSQRDRPDFVVGGSVGIECKIAGSQPQVLAQLLRYAENESIGSIVLVTSKASHRSIDGMKLQGKLVNVFFCSNRPF